MSILSIFTQWNAQQRLLSRLKGEIKKHRTSAHTPPAIDRPVRAMATTRLSDEDFSRLFMAVENFLPAMHPEDLQALLKAVLRRRLVKIFKELGHRTVT